MAEDENYHRNGDKQIAVFGQQLKDFIDRYERDRIASDKKYEADWLHTQQWRKAHYDKIENIEKFVETLKPIIDPMQKFLTQMNSTRTAAVWLAGAVVGLGGLITWFLNLRDHFRGR